MFSHNTNNLFLDADACTAKKLGTNGGYNCSGDSDSFSCSISCPTGIQFEFQPEPLYTCYYSTGIFAPNPIPKCVYRKYSNSLDPNYIFSDIFQLKILK